MSDQPRIHLASIALSTLLVGLLAACSGAGAGPTSPGPSDGSPDPSASPGIDLPSTPDTLVQRVSQEGGFAMPEMLATRLPMVSVYADGRVIEQGAQIEIYPAPFLPALFVSRITPEQVRDLLARAVAAGLASGANTSYPATSVADAPDTVFEVRVNGVLTRTSFGAFGMDQMGLAAAETKARADAAAFQAAIPMATMALGDATPAPSEPYVPRAARLIVRDYTPNPDLAQQPVDWAGTTPLATGGTPIVAASPELGRCIVVSGSELAAVWPSFEKANGLTPFVSEGKQWSLAIRPLLPDEEPICP